MSAKTVSSREKLSEPVLIRLTATDYERLKAVAAAVEKEPVEFIRRAAMQVVAQHEEQYALREIGRLREAGIDLRALVEYALGRHQAERAQASLPGLFSGGSRP